jgi:hypothetical protein
MIDGSGRPHHPMALSSTAIPAAASEPPNTLATLLPTPETGNSRSVLPHAGISFAGNRAMI